MNLPFGPPSGKPLAGNKTVPDTIGFLLALFAFGLAAYLVWAVFAIVWDMVEDRGHNPWAWLFISLAWSPFGSMFVLWLFFPTQDEESEGET